jgi:hypothetical protein
MIRYDCGVNFVLQTFGINFNRKVDRYTVN